MLNIKVVCVGKVKETSLRDLIDEYLKRLSKYSKVEIIEIQDEKLPISPSIADEMKIKEMESNKIIQKLEKIGKATIFALDLTGKDYSSENFSKKIQEISTYESSTIVFIIGGSLGMTDTLLNMCDYKICFSKMTFPHQLIRLFLLEQVFRAFKIQNNETYHH